MRKKPTEEEIRRILEMDLPYRELGRIFGRSPTFIQRVKKGTITWEKNGEKKKKKPGPAGLDDFTRVIFTEYARISRYGVSEICGFLSPFLNGLPSDRISERELTFPRKVQKEVSKKTLGRILQKAGISTGPARSEAYSATVVIHRIPIEWMRTREESKFLEPQKAEVLCILERSSGFLFLKAYKNGIDFRAIENCFKKFNVHNSIKPKNIAVIGKKEDWTFKKENSIETVNIEGFIQKYFPKGIDIAYDISSTEFIEPLRIKEGFKSLKVLNSIIFDITNKYLFLKRLDRYGRGVDKFCPLSRQWAAYQIENNRYPEDNEITSQRELAKRLRVKGRSDPLKNR